MKLDKLSTKTLRKHSPKIGSRRERIDDLVPCPVQVIEDYELAPGEDSASEGTKSAILQCCQIPSPACKINTRELGLCASLPAEVDVNLNQSAGTILIELEGSLPFVQCEISSSCKKSSNSPNMPTQLMKDECLKRPCKRKRSTPTSNTFFAVKDKVSGAVGDPHYGEHMGLRFCFGKRGCKSVDHMLDTVVDISDEDDIHAEAKQQVLQSGSKMRSACDSIPYPSRDDPEAIEIKYSDLQHLAPSEFLNDTVIDFYIKYIQQKLMKAASFSQFYFFNSFFYKKLLIAKEAKREECFEKLRKWTKGINIFEKLYLLMPIHDKAHWSLAIICFSRRKEATYLLHLDSMSRTSGHPSVEVFEVLESYLAVEKKCLLQGRHSMTRSRVVSFKEFVRKRVQVPLQDNEWDCGLFMLYYMQCFVQVAPTDFTHTELREMFGRSWFKPYEASELRGFILKLLESLFDFYDTQ